MNSDNRQMIAVITTKKLDPPEDGRADIIRKLLDILKDSGKDKILLLSFEQQGPYICENFETVVIKNEFNIFQIAGDVLSGFPLQLALYNNRKVREKFKEIVQERQVDLIITDMLRTSLIALYTGTRSRILDMDDLLSRRYRRRTKTPGGTKFFGKLPGFIPRPLIRIFQLLGRWIINLEAQRMEKYEARLARYFNYTILVSQIEAELLNSRSGQSTVLCIPNYIDFENQVARYNPKDNHSPELLFFGNLSTPHNVDGALYLGKTVFPLIRQKYPAAKLLIVGRDVSPRVVPLSEMEGIEIHPDVPDIAEYIKRASVCLCPLRFGSGIKTKILESLYLGTPVVTTPMGAEGIPEAEQCMVICNTDEEVVAGVESVIEGKVDIPMMLEYSRRVLKDYYSKSAVTKKWLSTIESALHDQQPPA